MGYDGIRFKLKTLGNSIHYSNGKISEHHNIIILRNSRRGRQVQWNSVNVNRIATFEATACCNVFIWIVENWRSHFKTGRTGGFTRDLGSVFFSLQYWMVRKPNTNANFSARSTLLVHNECWSFFLRPLSDFGVWAQRTYKRAFRPLVENRTLTCRSIVS